MMNIEQQLSQMSVIKESISNTNTRVTKLGEEVTELKSKVRSYDESISSYSDCYDDIIRLNTESE